MAITVEDGTVVAGADGYEDAADTSARLVLLGLTTFDSKPTATQEGTIRRSTVECENQIRSGVEGSQVVDEHLRLFPRTRCFDTDAMREFESTEIPEALKAGIAHRCEDREAGRVAKGDREIRREKDERGEIEYVASGKSRFRRDSPEADEHLRRLRWRQ